MTQKVFIHGVPDSPRIWEPLIGALGLTADEVTTPALPGFETPPPVGFNATKEAYSDWAVSVIEPLAAAHGPVDLVGHDWGGILAHRTALTRPDLLRSVVLTNGMIDPDYRGHKLARQWNTPVLGEFVSFMMSIGPMAKALNEGGIPMEIAEYETANWKKRHMRKCVLTLYRSANGLNFSKDWAADDVTPSVPGCIVAGAEDPYVERNVIVGLGKRTGLPVTLIEGAGHWAIAQAPDKVAPAMQAFWAGL